MRYKLYQVYVLPDYEQECIGEFDSFEDALKWFEEENTTANEYLEEDEQILFEDIKKNVKFTQWNDPKNTNCIYENKEIEEVSKCEIDDDYNPIVWKFIPFCTISEGGTQINRWLEENGKIKNDFDEIINLLEKIDN